MSKENTPPETKVFVNPIDKDKVAENPGLLHYAHSVGGAIIKPLDKGRMKGNAMSAMYEQTGVQLTQIKNQVELLLAQAAKIQHRMQISEMIYKADINLRPVVGHHYHLYKRENGKYVMSLIAPDEWGAKKPFDYIASVRLLSDHTWDVTAGEVDTEEGVIL